MSYCFRAISFIIFAVGVFLNTSTVLAFSDAKCGVRIHGMDQIFVIQGRSSQIRMTAEQACATRIGLPYQLSSVKIEIYKNRRLIDVKVAENALYDSVAEKIVGQFVSRNEVSRLTFMNLKTGIIQSSGRLEQLK